MRLPSLHVFAFAQPQDFAIRAQGVSVFAPYGAAFYHGVPLLRLAVSDADV